MITLSKEQRNTLWDQAEPFLHEFQLDTAVAALYDLGLVGEHGMPTEQGEALRRRLAQAGWDMAVEREQFRSQEGIQAFAERRAANDPVLTFENRQVENVPYLLSRARSRAAALVDQFKDADNYECRLHVNHIGHQCCAALAALQRLRGRAAGFDGWYQSKIEEMLVDELVRYMFGRYGDRSQIVDVSSEGITVSYENSDEAKFTYFYPAPPDVIDYFDQDDQCGSGFLIERHGAVIKKYVHVTEIKHLMSPPGPIVKFINHIRGLAEEGCRVFGLSQAAARGIS